MNDNEFKYHHDTMLAPMYVVFVRYTVEEPAKPLGNYYFNDRESAEMYFHMFWRGANQPYCAPNYNILKNSRVGWCIVNTNANAGDIIHVVDDKYNLNGNEDIEIKMPNADQLKILVDWSKMQRYPVEPK